MRKYAILLFLILLFLPSSAIASNDALFPIHFVIDAGHGGIDGGTSYESIYEKHINLEIAKKIYSVLTNEGFSVILNRTGDYALSDDNEWSSTHSRHKRDLAQRRGLISQIDPQVMVSLHVNWAKNKNTRGGLVLYQKNNQSFLLSDILQHHLNELYHTKEEPRAGGTYYLLRHSICPTVIIEMGFLSNELDREQLTVPEKQDELVKAICSALHEYRFIVADMENNEQKNNRAK